MQEQPNITAPTGAQSPKKPSKALVCGIVIAGVLLLVSAVVLCVHYVKEKYASLPPEMTSEPVPASETESYPAEPAEVQPKYRAAYNANYDFVGWITVPNTAIDLPVYQGEDNDFYLRRDANKEYLRRGSIFMDYRNSVSEFNRNTILYGHNYLDSTMFSDLEKYKDIAFYQTAPVIEFNTIYKDYQWKVFAVFLTTASPELDNGYVFNYIYPFMTEENFVDFIDEVQTRSLYRTGVDILPSDKILTLSTCTRDLDLSENKQEDARLVVMARLVRDGESAEENTAYAVENENPKYPQLYYDKYNLKNPYKNDAKWYPRGEQ
ncbi:MAG: class B sortase [Candidatus Fimenecus sp.]